jgi:uncharacterized integral membrane protein
MKSSENLSKIEYQETQAAPAWALAFGSILVLVLIFLLIMSLSGNGFPGFLKFIWLAILLLLLFILINFRQMRVVITARELVVAYGLFRKVIPREVISGVEEINLTFVNTGGIGIRLTSLGYNVYNTRWGRALRIDRRDGGKSFGFTADNIDLVKEILLKTAKP